MMFGFFPTPSVAFVRPPLNLIFAPAHITCPAHVAGWIIVSPSLVANALERDVSHKRNCGIGWSRIPTTRAPFKELSTKLYPRRLMLSRFALATPVCLIGSHPHFSRMQTLPLLPLRHCKHLLCFEVLILIIPFTCFQRSPVSPPTVLMQPNC